MDKLITGIVLIFTCLLFNTAYAQRVVDIPAGSRIENFVENLPRRLRTFDLPDLRETSDSLTIRFWLPSRVITLNYGANPYCNEKLNICKYMEDTEITKNIDYPIHVLDSLYQKVHSLDILQIKDDPARGIGAISSIVEISTPTIYKIVSYFTESTELIELEKNISTVFNAELNTEDRYWDFIETLEPGSYGKGPYTHYRIDYFPSDIKKTNFFVKAEKEIRKEYNITDSTSHTKYPLIRINEEDAFISDLNKYKKKDIKSFTMYPPGMGKATVFYGARVLHTGVVVVETK